MRQPKIRFSHKADLPPDEIFPTEFAAGSLNFRITAYNEELVLREIIQQSHLPLVYCMIEDLPIGYCFSCHDTKTGDRVDIETVERATKNGTGHRYQFVHFYNPLKDGIAPRKSESWYRIKGALIKLTMNINWSDECDLTVPKVWRLWKDKLRCSKHLWIELCH